MVRTAVIAQQLPGEQHVLGRDRLAVGKMGARIKTEGDKVSGVVGLDGFRKQAIERERLVLAARHQALHDIAALGAVAPDLLDGQASDNHGIEAVECAGNAPDQPSAPWRIGIEVGQVREIGAESRGAMHRNPEALLRPRRAGAKRDRAYERKVAYCANGYAP